MKTFSVQKTENNIVLFNLEGIENLRNGDIFFRRNKDNSTLILPYLEYLDKNYLNSVVDNLTNGEQYDFSLLESKTI